MAAYTNYRRDPRVRREAEALTTHGFRVTFMASSQPNEPDRETVSGVEVIKVRSLGNRRTSMAVYILDYTLFLFWSMLHLTLRPRRYALIHVNNMPDFLVFAAWLPRLLGVPVIHDVHDLMPELFEEKFSGRRYGRWIAGVIRAQERWAGRFASAVLTVEDRLKGILAARGVPPDRIHVLMNLPDDRLFAPRLATPARSAHSPVVIVYHGTLARRLGLDFAILALQQVRAAGHDCVLRIIGAGEEREALISLRDRLGLGEAVEFSAGFVPVQDVPQLIADADIGICPLRVSDGTDIMLPTKLLEYVTIGIPCIVPRTTTITRYFDDTMVQFFDAEDVQSLASAIAALAQSPARRQALASEATRRFATTYRWSHHQRVYVDLVRRLIAGADRNALSAQ